MKTIGITLLALFATVPTATSAAAQETAPERSFDTVSGDVQQDLEASLRELAELRSRIAAEMIPLSRELSALENELIEVRLEYQKAKLLLDTRTLDLSNIGTRIKAREDETTYLTNQLNEYLRKFESILHIAEVQRYAAPIEHAKLALENSGLSELEVFEAQAQLLAVSLDRLFDALGGTRFEGTAVDPTGLVDQGIYTLVGPVALFRSADGADVGTAEQRLGSLEPTLVPFGDPLDAAAAVQVLTSGAGNIPIDVTLGNAHKIEATKESFAEHVGKGGPVMIPIFVMAGLAMLVALYKWLSMAFVRKPSRKRIDALLQAVAAHDPALAKERAAEIRGPVGKMLTVGVEHMREPRELVEEVMYETVLTTRLRLQRMLPFIAICAASAPLLGLLGTVTGIINTFKLITVFGSGDVKTLSGGISEALITTEWGLIVAIPSLLIHAFLSRKARGVIGDMETAAVALVNQLGRTPFPQPVGERRRDVRVVAAPGPEVVRKHVRDAVREMMAPLAGEDAAEPSPRAKITQPS